MNNAVAMPVDLMAVNVGEMLAVPTVQSEQRIKRFAAGEVINNIVSVVEDLLSATIEQQTAAGFLATRAEVFPQYFQAVRALSDLARILVPKHVLDVVLTQSFSETEAEFRDQGLIAFGAEVRDQAMFTVWILRKISDLCQKIDGAHLAPQLRESDQTMYSGFVAHAVGARFHLDCLLKSMLVQKPMRPEVFPIVIDGLRNAVNAYAWARRAYDLRVQRVEADIAETEWDEEDQQLLREATYDDIALPL